MQLVNVGDISKQLEIPKKRIHNYIRYYEHLKKYKMQVSRKGVAFFSPEIVPALSEIVNSKEKILKDTAKKARAIQQQMRKVVEVETEGMQTNDLTDLAKQQLKQYACFYVTEHSVKIEMGSINKKKFLFGIEIDRLQKITVSFTMDMGLKIHVGDLKFTIEILPDCEFHYEIEGSKYIDKTTGAILKESAGKGMIKDVKAMHEFVKGYFNVVN